MAKVGMTVVSLSDYDNTAKGGSQGVVIQLRAPGSPSPFGGTLGDKYYKFSLQNAAASDVTIDTGDSIKVDLDEAKTEEDSFTADNGRTYYSTWIRDANENTFSF